MGGGTTTKITNEVHYRYSQVSKKEKRKTTKKYFPHGFATAVWHLRENAGFAKMLLVNIVLMLPYRPKFQTTRSQRYTVLSWRTSIM
jgi:hypothetical protein